MNESYLKHKEKAPKSLNFAVLTISTSKYQLKKSGRKEVQDKSGDLIVKLLTQSNHRVVARKLIPDNPTMIKKDILKFTKSNEIDVIITTGGTGVTKKDLTIETVEGILQKKLPGFGEILRKLSFERIGSAAILTRAIAGIRNGKAIFCLPGSPDAVEVAVKYLIISEATHIVKHARE
ncbi:molybdenum cofactor biosynthesis protein [Candidatus Bathyarchaeota archaeon]|nr:MAG: molybdenum cofactor biosynthesis protein [Candidatus Bathyarchaeota archaeon]